MNLPDRAIVRIYSSSGVLVRVLEHNSRTSGELTWNVRNRYGHLVASGVYSITSRLWMPAGSDA